MTPAGMTPASRARSTDASVWPVRSSTPPSRALSGWTCPGTTMSASPLAGSIAVRIVCAWSAVEMPVVTPSRASMVTVNGVSWAASFLSVISSSPSASQRSAVSVRQIHPPAWRVMKLMSLAVTNSAAITRSPSFSRSSSSTTTTILPAAMSSNASSMVENLISARVGNELLHVFREDVNLEVDLAAGLGLPQRRPLQRLRDERHGEPVVADLADRQRDAVHGDRALLHHIAQQRRVGVEGHHPRESPLAGLADEPPPVHVTLHDMPAEPVGGAQRELEVDLRPRLQLAQRRAPQRLLHHVGAEQLAAAHARRGQADAVDRHAVALAQLTGQGRAHAQPHAVRRAVDAVDLTEILHEACEHAPTTPAIEPISARPPRPARSRGSGRASRRRSSRRRRPPSGRGRRGHPRASGRGRGAPR